MNLKKCGRPDGWRILGCSNVRIFLTLLPILIEIINYSRDIDVIHKPDVYIEKFIKSGLIKG
jgi:hypothetical protein